MASIRHRLVALAVLAAGLPLLLAQVAEYDVKAAFLLNFTKFIDWPASAFADAQSPFAVCILGKDPFGRSLDNVVAGETVARRPLVVRRLQQPPAAQMCQLVFIEESEKDQARVLSAMPRGVLTVGENERFLRDGGMVRLLVENRRVRFDIHQSAAEAAGLKLSSKLLSVARAVEK